MCSLSLRPATFAPRVPASLLSQGIFTELGILYAKYRPEKLMEHVKVYWSRVNVSKLLRAVEAGRHWEAAAYLYIQTGDADQGVRVMIKHSPVAYNSDKFLEIIQKVRWVEGAHASRRGWLTRLERPHARVC
jgi:clathrin heavy chain